MSDESKKQQFPPQHQNKQPGVEHKMNPEPVYERDDFMSAKRLQKKVALVTGGDSGIGRAVSIAFAKEGADIAICYKDEHADALKTKERIEEIGRSCLLIPGDLSHEYQCKDAVNKTLATFDKIDVLVNNCAQQYPQEKPEQISAEQMQQTFAVNFYSYFYMIQAALPYLKKGASIINTTSVTAYRGSEHLIDYSSTKGAIVSLTRSLSQEVIDKGIRVNGVAPGPVWTPLIVSSFDAEHVKTFGNHVPMKRAGQPCEIAPAFVFLASEDASYFTGQVLHPNGGEMVGG